jgi:hypothetical protein
LLVWKAYHKFRGCLSFHDTLQKTPGQTREPVLFTVTSVEKFRIFTAESHPSVNALVVGIIEIKLTTFGASGTVSFTPL